MLSASPSPPPPTSTFGTLWVDRHLHKNGGSTMREVMLRNEEAGNCLYYGYTQTREGWDRLVASLRKLAASAEFTPLRIPDMLQLRALFEARRVPIRVVLTTRVREPLAYYISFYRWRVAGMQRNGNVIRLSKTKSVVQPLGSSFLDWAPENLQSIGLLWGDVELFAGLKAGGWPGVKDAKAGRRPHPFWVKYHQFGANEYQRLLKSLDGEYDVVAPTERFDEHLLLVSDATGLPPLQEEQFRAVAPDPQAMRGYRLKDLEVCPNMTKCREHVERIAPWDVALYKHVQAGFEARLAKDRDGFAARLAKHRAARKRNEGICTPGASCCCGERLPCFNMTGRERRYREPPSCMPGPRHVQLVVSSDMPLGWCCTNRPPRRKGGKGGAAAASHKQAKGRGGGMKGAGRGRRRMRSHVG